MERTKRSDWCPSLTCRSDPRRVQSSVADGSSQRRRRNVARRRASPYAHTGAICKHCSFSVSAPDTLLGFFFLIHPSVSCDFQIGGVPLGSLGGPGMDAMAALGIPGPNMNPQVRNKIFLKLYLTFCLVVMLFYLLHRPKSSVCFCFFF